MTAVALAVTVPPKLNEPEADVVAVGPEFAPNVNGEAAATGFKVGSVVENGFIASLGLETGAVDCPNVNVEDVADAAAVLEVTAALAPKLKEGLLSAVDEAATVVLAAEEPNENDGGAEETAGFSLTVPKENFGADEDFSRGAAVDVAATLLVVEDPRVKVEEEVDEVAVVPNENPLEAGSALETTGSAFFEESLVDSPKSNLTVEVCFFGTLIPPRRSGGPPVLPPLGTRFSLAVLEMLPRLNVEPVVTVLELPRLGVGSALKGFSVAEVVFEASEVETDSVEA